MAKFNSIDRTIVIKALEESLDVSLSKIGRRQKNLEDEDGVVYWVLGGYENWHGIPEEMMDAACTSDSLGKLIVAIRKLSEIEIYISDLSPLLEDKWNLMRASRTTGDYQFTYQKVGATLILDQIPKVILTHLKTVGVTDQDVDSLQRQKKAQKLLDSLSAKEREELISKLTRVDEKGER